MAVTEGQTTDARKHKTEHAVRFEHRGGEPNINQHIGAECTVRQSKMHAETNDVWFGPVELHHCTHEERVLVPLPVVQPTAQLVSVPRQPRTVAGDGGFRCQKVRLLWQRRLMSRKQRLQLLCRHSGSRPLCGFNNQARDRACRPRRAAQLLVQHVHVPVRRRSKTDRAHA